MSVHDLTKFEEHINDAPPGWRPLVTKLITDLLDTGWDGDVQQVKEKFGGLRFYVGALNDRQWDLIRAAMEESYKICDVCGEPGEQRNLPWIRTLCDKHYEERRSANR